MAMAPTPTCDSALSPCFHGCPAFLHRHFPSQSPPSHPLDPSLRGQQQPLPWDCSIIPKFQLPVTAPSRGPASLIRLCMAAAKDYLILLPFRLPQTSCFTPSLKCFSSDSDYCPNMGIRSLLQFPHLLRAGPVLLTLLFSHLVPSSYRVLRDSTYSFLLVRSSCLLSVGVLHTLLCLKVYPDVSMQKRCTPRPLTPLPSCSHSHWF